MNRFLLFIFILINAVGCTVQNNTIKSHQESPQRPQQFSPDSILLPTGLYLTPTGTSIPVGDFPMNIAVSPDKKHAVIVNAGYGQQTLSIVNIEKRSVVQTLKIKGTWYGAKWSPLGDYFFISAGNDNRIYRYGFENDSAWFISSLYLGKPAPEEYISPAGLDLNSDGSEMYVVSRMNNMLYKLNVYENNITSTLQFDSPLYGCVFDKQRNFIYVSVWGNSKIAIVDAKKMEIFKWINVDSHPSEMAMHPSDSLLAVVNSNSNTVSFINLNTQKIFYTQDVTQQPFGKLPNATPNSICFSSDGEYTYVACADINSVAYFHSYPSSVGQTASYIPVGWYPTSLRIVDSTLLVANGKGNSSFPNSNNENIAELLNGTLSFIQLPIKDWKEYNHRVFGNYERLLSEGVKKHEYPEIKTALNSIKHVFYIIKENRTYDDVFGDMKKGNGDSSLCRFGYDVTPNHHALAEEFVLFDNFYSIGEVGADGINWATAAYANDYIEKTWPTLYSRRGGEYDYEKEGMVSPPNGYLWDIFQKNELRVRNYGLFLDEDASERGEIIPLVKGLIDVTSPIYRGWDLNYFDTTRASMWIKEFDEYVQGDSLPHLSLIRLPNDHTAGKSSNYRSQKAFLADNDLALGMVVEKISHSKYWKESVIFIVETNAQGGADHIDAHRTVALVVSPYTKRKFVDCTLYTSLSMLRTIQDIFNLNHSLSLHDNNAPGMHNAFQSVPDFTPYNVLPNKIPLNEMGVIR